MAIPEGGFFTDKVEQGRYGPIVKFFRDHQCPSFLAYSEHPYVTCEEIKKALTLKAAFSNALDQMQ
jgi:hypothetical protein